MGLAEESDGPDDSAAFVLPETAVERAKLDKNDRGNAPWLAAMVGPDLVYCREWGWGVWTGTHFEFDAGEVRAFDLCMRLQDIVEEEARAWRDAPVDDLAIAREISADAKRTPAKKVGAHDPDTAEKVIRMRRYIALMEHAEKCGNVTIVEKAMKALPPPLVRVSLADLDSAPHLLTVQNGQIDLAAVAKPAAEAEDDDERLARLRGFLRPNTREGRPTRVCRAAYVPGAPRPKFQALLDLVQPRPHLQAYLKRCCGQMVSGSNDYQVALLWQGEGANGKSTLINILTSVLGSCVADCKIEMFLATELRSSAAPTPDEAELPGARVYTASEPEPDAALSDAKVKAFTGGDPRKSRANYGDPFRWHPRGVPVLSFNRMPSIKGDSYGTRRRLAFVPFTANLRKLPEAQQRAQADVEAEMVPEYPGILDWLLEGYAESRDLGGLLPPPGADTMKEALLSDADPVGEFVAACCVHDESGRIRTSELYRTFTAWAEDAGARSWRDVTVRKVMVQKGYKAAKHYGYPHFYGLRWNDEAATEDSRSPAAFATSPTWPAAPALPGRRRARPSTAYGSAASTRPCGLAALNPFRSTPSAPGISISRSTPREPDSTSRLTAGAGTWTPTAIARWPTGFATTSCRFGAGRSGASGCTNLPKTWRNALNGSNGNSGGGEKGRWGGLTVPALVILLGVAVLALNLLVFQMFQAQQTALAERERELLRREGAVEALESKKDALVADISRLEDERQRAREAVEKARAEVRDTERVRAARERAIEERDRALDAAKKVETERAEAERERDALRKETTELERKRTDLREAVTAAEDRLRALKSDITTAQRKADNIRPVVADLESERSRLREAVDELRAQAQPLRDEVAALESRRREAEAARADAESRAAEAKAREQAMRERIASLAEEEARLTEAIDQLTKDRDALSQEVAKLDEARAQLERARAERAQALAAVEEARRAAADLKETREALAEEEEQLAALTSKRRAVQEKLTELGERSAELAAKVERLETRAAELEDVETTLAETSRELEARRTELSALEEIPIDQVERLIGIYRAKVRCEKGRPVMQRRLVRFK